MKSPALILAAAALLVAVVLAVAIGPWGRSGAAVERISAEQGPRGDAGAEVAPATLARPGEQDAGSRAAAVSEEGEARWVEGAVRVPASCAADPELEVLALDEDLEYRRLAERLLDDEPRGLVARRPVGPDGAFRVPFPADSAEGWVAVRGRYLYTPRCTRVDLSGGDARVELSAEAGACLLGRVTWPAGEERDELEVEVESDLGSAHPASSRAGAVRIELELEPEEDGGFVLRALPVEQGYRLVAHHPRLAAVRASVAELEPCVDRSIDFALTAGGSVRGRVVDSAGRAVAGAEVAAFFPGAFFGIEDETARAMPTDADGRFHLVGLTPGSLRLRAEAPGRIESDRVPVTITEGEEVAGIVIELDEGASISGVVSWEDGGPASGVRVEVSFDPTYLAGLEAFNALRGAEGDATTGDEGRFRVTGLGKGPFVVRAGAAPPDGEEAGEDDERWTARAAGVRPGETDVALVLRRPVGLRGRVIDDVGAPVGSFHVHVRRATDGPIAGIAEEDFRRTEHVTSEDGAFLVEHLAPGSYELWVQDEDHVSLEVVAVDLPQAEPVEVLATRTAAVSGVVRSPQGDPVEGARVTVLGGSDLTRMIEGGPQPPKTESGRDGSFRLAGIAPGATGLIAESEDWARSPVVDVELAPAEELEEVAIVLSLGGTLTGEVYGSDGERAPGRMITVMSADAMLSGGVGQRLAQSDSRGEFRFDHIEAGSWQVTAIDRGTDWMAQDGEIDVGRIMSSLEMSQAQVVEGETTHVVLGAPPSDPVRVFGSVTLAGEPFAGASVSFYPEGGKLYEGLSFTSVDAAGDYELTLDGPGHYVVNVQRLPGGPGQQTTIELRAEIPEAAEHRLDFELPVGRISGRVLGPDGAPARDTRVTLTLDDAARSDRLFGGQYSELVADAEGRFDVPGLRPGTYRLSAGGATLFGQGSRTHGRVTLGGIELAEGQWRDDLELRLPVAGSLLVRVRGADGRPASGATVFVRDAQGRPLEPFSMIMTDAGGKAEVGGLAPGEVTVLARTATHASRESEPVRIREGERAEIELGLEAGTILWIQLEERGEGGPVRASVRVEDERGRDVAALFGFQDLQVLYVDGGFSPTEHRLGPLAPGRYVVHAEAGGQSAKKPVTLEGEEERKLVLRLK